MFLYKAKALYVFILSAILQLSCLPIGEFFAKKGGKIVFCIFFPLFLAYFEQNSPLEWIFYFCRSSFFYIESEFNTFTNSFLIGLSFLMALVKGTYTISSCLMPIITFR